MKKKKKENAYLFGVSRIRVAGVSGSLESLFKIELRSDFSADAIAHGEAGAGDVSQNDVVFAGHGFSSFPNPRLKC